MDSGNRRGDHKMKLFAGDTLSLPHGVLDFLGTVAISVGAGTWAHHRKWREGMDRKMGACILGINHLLSKDPDTPDFIKHALEQEISK